MPFVTVITNVTLSDVPDSFHEALTDIMVKALQKPKEVLYVDLRADANMTMGANRHPCVYATVECIGRLNPEFNLSMGTTLEDFFIQHLNVKRDRIIIRFIPVQAQFAYFKGALFDVSIEKDEDLKNKQAE